MLRDRTNTERLMGMNELMNGASLTETCFNFALIPCVQEFSFNWIKNTLGAIIPLWANENTLWNGSSEIIHTHSSPYSSRQRPNQTRFLFCIFVNLWAQHNSALKLQSCPCYLLLSKAITQKQGVQFEEKDTLIMGVRDEAPSSHYGIFSNTITHPLTKILSPDNGAMKSCSTMHNCSFWNIDEWS